MRRLFGFDAPEVRRMVGVLSEIGFLEADSDIYRVPHLYRAGLNIAHGKAF